MKNILIKLDNLNRKQRIQIIAIVINTISIIVGMILSTMICRTLLPGNLYIGKAAILYFGCIGAIYIVTRSLLILIFKRPIFKLFKM